MKISIMVALAALSYLLIILFNRKKTWISLGAALIVLALGFSAPDRPWLEALGTGLSEHLNWNVLMIYLGSLLAAEFFILSGIPASMSEAIASRAPNAGVAVALICLLTGLVSAFVENVATLLVMAPIAIEMARRMKIPLSPVLIMMAVSSNLQGTATLIGDPPSMIFAEARGYGFMDFFFHLGRPSIFFMVEAGALAAFLLSLWIFRNNRDKPPAGVGQTIESWVPLVILILMVVGLALVPLLLPDFHMATGLVCLAAGLAGILWFLLTRGDLKKLWALVRGLDWESMAFLCGIFILLGGISASGALDRLAHLLDPVAEAGVFPLFLTVLALSVMISGFVDNVPYILLMLPVIATLTEGMPASFRIPVDFALLIGSCLGGNVTPFGASASVVAMGLARKNGEKPSFKDFIRIGLPVTLVSTAAAALTTWLVWKP